MFRVCGLMPKSEPVWHELGMRADVPYFAGAHCVGCCAAKGAFQSCPGQALLESVGSRVGAVAVAFRRLRFQL